jgi:hypothetical protein
LPISAFLELRDVRFYAVRIDSPDPLLTAITAAFRTEASASGLNVSFI